MTSIHKIQKQILGICYKNKLSHIGSYISCLPILHRIFSDKHPADKVVLSCGHSSVALYCCLEAFEDENAEALLEKHGCHPNLDPRSGIDCSTGSLGLGITVAVGYAVSNPDRKVHCIISDGECAEGSVWESLNFISKNNIKNINIYVNANGYCAYDSVDLVDLRKKLAAFVPDRQLYFYETDFLDTPCLKGLNAHYHIMSEEDYNKALAHADAYEQYCEDYYSTEVF
tara:strand:- start:12210 stop:12893 length:684 start_codon:yes stop_codon:yes gene_type:complete